MSQITQVSDTVKHSAAHILAMAVKRIFPDVKIGIGPVTKEGFYYDFELPTKLTKKLLKQIEEESKKIIEEDLPFTQMFLAKENATNLLLQSGQIYKAELIHGISDAEVSFYKTGEEFMDLCRGPHVQSTGEVGVISILRTQEVNWKEDTTRPMMQRVFGAAFRNDEELFTFTEIQEEIKKRDYRKISQDHEYGYFFNKNTFLLTSRGTYIVKEIEKVIRRELITPSTENIRFANLVNAEIVDVVNSYISSRTRSYKELPLKLLSVFPVKSNVKNEEILAENLTFLNYYKTSDLISFFGLDLESILNVFEELHIEISANILCTNLEDNLVSSISNILKSKHVSHNKVLSNNVEYIEIQIKAIDSLDREWIMNKIRIYNREKPIYMNAQGKLEKTLVIESTFVPLNIYAFIIENSIGKISEKLKPIKVVCIPLNNKHLEYAEKIKKLLEEAGISTQVDKRSRSMQGKIKSAENEGVPVILLVGNKEVLNGSVSVRHDQMQVGLISQENIIEYLNNYLYN